PPNQRRSAMKRLTYAVVVTAAVLVVVGCPTRVRVTGVTLNYSDWAVLNSGSPFQEQLIATVEPSDATSKNVTWESSDPVNFPVSSAGLVTNPTAGGGAGENLVVTVTTGDGGFKATCTGTASCP